MKYNLSLIFYPFELGEARRIWELTKTRLEITKLIIKIIIKNLYLCIY